MTLLNSTQAYAGQEDTLIFTLGIPPCDNEYISDTLNVCDCTTVAKYYCPLHWEVFAQARLHDILAQVGNRKAYLGRFSVRGIYDYDKHYGIMRKLGNALTYKYPELLYLWVKHLSDDYQVHYHWTFLMESGFDLNVPRNRFAKIVNKYCDKPYAVGDCYVDTCESLEGWLRYCLGLTHKYNPHKVPPWGQVYGHVVDGNLAYRQNQIYEKGLIPF